MPFPTVLVIQKCLPIPPLRSPPLPLLSGAGCEVLARALIPLPSNPGKRRRLRDKNRAACKTIRGQTSKPWCHPSCPTQVTFGAQADSPLQDFLWEIDSQQCCGQRSDDGPRKSQFGKQPGLGGGPHLEDQRLALFLS